MKKNMIEPRVLVCRVEPPHLGHEALIHQMIDNHPTDRCLLVIGSDNTQMSMRHFFSYQDRKHMIKRLFPGLRVVGHGDFRRNGERDDAAWLSALDDKLSLWTPDPMQVVFYGGCDEDIAHFIKAGRKTRVVNRFDGTTPKISATEVRDALIHKRSLKNLVNKLIVRELREIFQQNWNYFEKI